eukprot:CAMPEP_0197684954 /NCGR_PEP_ID=MMETSP1338-20131121/100206_1 /TAXON_ID=43686 ORGANISM="Pelagodinium beii, Strain RCC1491" /NCGR_SAMPLE_ID=MMETSP1338 /ASSEMBLY_ACC=CAM_ASM_000754 /LENGTH=33 /DNA_ID= /DNA_START= /DNA_END= /DNA_ORIENTATION=
MKPEITRKKRQPLKKRACSSSLNRAAPKGAQSG